ncbi:hypothetical protein NDU88_011312 [Pleurodeles waltl]|uniref:Uncharacterized protein n=1 Tax=Pleurodeles waltl TaxID=8319 RepID=A0AAV7Q095_PLEWA|nr:hypothetical protein NDU88_011312 [Pleurodeles waltl]
MNTPTWESPLIPDYLGQITPTRSSKLADPTRFADDDGGRATSPAILTLTLNVKLLPILLYVSLARDQLNPEFDTN